MTQKEAKQLGRNFAKISLDKANADSLQKDKALELFVRIVVATEKATMYNIGKNSDHQHKLEMAFINGTWDHLDYRFKT